MQPQLPEAHISFKLVGNVFTSVINSQKGGLKEALVEFMTDEKDYTIYVNYVLICYMILWEQICRLLC